MSKKTTTKAACRPKAPLPPVHLRLLAQSFMPMLPTETLTAAYAMAGALMEDELHLDDERGRAEERAVNWIENAAQSSLAGCHDQAALTDKDSVVQTHTGDIQNAFADPSYALGFALAYRLLTEKGAGR